MKKLLSRLALLGLVSGLLIHPVRAAFDPAIVGADAQWVFHADLNALRSSTLGKELVTMAEKMQIAQGDVKVGVDVQKLLTTIGSATAYGSNFAKDPENINGTLVIRGTPDLTKIAEAALIQATLGQPDRVSELKGLPFPAYSIAGGPPKAAVKGPPPAQSAPDAMALAVIVAFPASSTVLVSKSQAQLLKANEVLRGSAPSLAKNPSSALNGFVRNAGDAYLFAASLMPSEKFFDETDAPQARVLQMTNAGSLTLGESGPQTYAHLELVASSGDSADKLVKILQGMTAMMSLAETNDKQLADFLNSAAVTRNDKSVTLHLAYDSDRLVAMIKTLQEGRSRSSTHSSPANNTKTVGEWKASDVTAGAEGVIRKVENVRLVNGSTIAVVARNAEGKRAQIDRLEVQASDTASAPLVFRGEYMRLSGFSVDAQPSAATGGKAITSRSPTSTARLVFPGAEGNYTIKVVYAGTVPEGTNWTLTIRDPETAAAPAAKTQE